jgi:hypothetical protein
LNFLSSRIVVTLKEKEASHETIQTPPGTIPDDLKAELQKLLENPKGGITDPEAAKRAREHMDRIREENRKLFGESDIAVELIRQTREH